MCEADSIGVPEGRLAEPGVAVEGRPVEPGVAAEGRSTELGVGDYALPKAEVDEARR